MHPLSRRFHRNFVFAATCFVLVGGAGCTYFRNLGTGTHYDNAHTYPTNPKSLQKRDMIVEVTTDAGGAVTSVQFKRSSGSDPIDSYVADSIRSNWPRTPSKITTAELTYTSADGFSQPREISSHPAP